MTKDQTTLRPWAVDGYDLSSIIVKQDTVKWTTVCRCPNGKDNIGTAVANAKLIVTAVNCHDELMEALEDALKLIPETTEPDTMLTIQRIEQTLSKVKGGV